jgi:hypothetical protein
VALIEDQRKCWAFAETTEPEPWRIPRAQWQIYNGNDWVAAPSDFSVTEVQAGGSLARSLPAGWERKVSRSTSQVYYFNTLVRITKLPATGLVGPYTLQPCQARSWLRGGSEYIAVPTAERQESVGGP